MKDGNMLKEQVKELNTIVNRSIKSFKTQEPETNRKYTTLITGVEHKLWEGTEFYMEAETGCTSCSISTICV